MGDDAPATTVAGDDVADIRDAACVLVVDDSGPEPRLLMGRRLETQVFLPDKWVFPGGRVDDADQALADAMMALDSKWALRADLRRFAVAAVRELFEETGLLLANRGRPETEARGPQQQMASAAPVSWQEFLASGHWPTPERLRPLARAITPPGFVRRYDTWFFEVSRKDIATDAGTADGELRGLDWFTLDAANALDVPLITRLVLQEFAAKRSSTASSAPVETVPLYTYADGTFQRTMVAC